MKTLITGATGFIGRRLLKKLLAEDRDICCLIRNSSNISDLESKGIGFMYGDIKNFSSIQKALNDVDVIYHLAADANPSNYRPYEDYEINVIGTENILKAAMDKNSIKKIVFMSSIAATGPSRDGNLLDENSKMEPITNYGISKVNAENIANEYYRKYNIPIVIIRPPMVYGIGDKDWIGFFQMIKNAGENDRKLFVPGHHKNLFDFCYVDNLVEGIVLAEKSNETIGKTYFLTDRKTYTIEEILIAVSKAYGVNVPKKFYSEKFMIGLAKILDKLGKIFHFDGPISERDIKWMTTNYWICNSKKAEEEFGYNPSISLEEGIKRTVNWYQNNKEGIANDS